MPDGAHPPWCCCALGGGRPRCAAHAAGRPLLHPGLPCSLPAPGWRRGVGGGPAAVCASQPLPASQQPAALQVRASAAVSQAMQARGRRGSALHSSARHRLPLAVAFLPPPFLVPCAGRRACRARGQRRWHA
jgi:hypothetical protein